MYKTYTTKAVTILYIVCIIYMSVMEEIIGIVSSYALHSEVNSGGWDGDWHGPFKFTDFFFTSEQNKLLSSEVP